jgi:hypothetical protein
LIANCPEASPDDRIRKGKKVKFAALVAKLSFVILEDPCRLSCARLNECMEVDYLLESGSDLTVIPRSILERLVGQSFVNEVPVDVFEIRLARSDVTVVCRAKVKLDVVLDTRARRVLIRDLQIYVVDAPMDVLFVGDNVFQKLGNNPQHLLEQKVASEEVKDVASPYPEDSSLNETFNEDYDEFRDIWKAKLSANGPGKVTPLKVHLKPDAVPRRAKVRRYAPKHLDFMRKQVKLLEEMG